MNIKGPIKIIIEGPRGSGKTQIIELLQNALISYGFHSWVTFEEGAKAESYGQMVTIIEKQS